MTLFVITELLNVIPDKNVIPSLFCALWRLLSLKQYSEKLITIISLNYNKTCVYMLITAKIIGK